MTTDERVIADLAEANPIPASASPTAQERAEAERILRRVLGEAPSRSPRRPRLPRLGILAPVISLVVVVAVAAVVLRTGGSAMTGSAPSGGLTITLSAQPTAQTPRITGDAMSREMAVMRRRLASLGRGFVVRQSGATGIVVTAPKARAAERGRIVQLITQPAQLGFYDWEANVLTTDGRTAASQLAAQNGGALSVSQGGNDGPGYPGSGSRSLYDAVKLANRQPWQRARRNLSRIGPEYYVFGAPGSAACAAVADVLGSARPVPGHCLLAGPLDLGPGAGPHQAVQAAAARYPSGVIPARAEVVAVPQGTIVVQSEQLQTSAPAPVSASNPAAQFFVLRDQVALTGNDITNPKPGTDQSGQPDVSFGFNGTGQAAFQRVTKQIAHRGANVSLAGNTLNQHFAVALDSRLLTVPQIDFRQYPDGIIGGGGADITGGFTPQSARDLATELRYGALPLSVRVVP